MSIIGPRPTVRAQVDKYDERQLGRLSVKPGITGWAQVNGRASLPWAERIELDLWYVEHQSARVDARILLRTSSCSSAATVSTAARPAAGADRQPAVARLILGE